MPITLPAPVVVPPVAEKTFPAGWVKTILINAPTPPTQENPSPAGSITVEILPYNAETGEITNGSRTITLQADLWPTIAAVREVATAMDAILVGIAALQAYQAAQAQPEGGE